MCALANGLEDVRKSLATLKSLCDTGFALAVHIRYTRPSLLYGTYGSDWTDYYSEKGFMMSDPVVHWGLVNKGSIEWSALDGQDPAGVLRDAKRFGLHNGWTFSTGPLESRTIAGLTRTVPFTETDRSLAIAAVEAVHKATEGIERFAQGDMDLLRKLL